MSDLIRRSALIEEFRKCHISFNGTPMEEPDMMISYRSIVRVINRQPPVESKPVVHGKWEKTRLAGEYICSNCQSLICSGFTRMGYEQYKFCPECGADMRKKVE